MAEGKKGKKAGKLILIGIVVVAILYFSGLFRGCTPPPPCCPPPGDISFMVDAPFFISKVLNNRNGYRDQDMPLKDRWALHLVFKPLVEYPRNEIVSGGERERPLDCLIQLDNAGRDPNYPNGLRYIVQFTKRDNSLTDADILSALNAARDYVQRSLNPNEIPQITTDIDQGRIIFRGLRSLDAVYQILSISRPWREDTRNRQLSGWGPYSFTGSYNQQVNEISLRKEWNNISFPQNLRIVTRSLIGNEINTHGEYLIVIPGFPPTNIPENYRLYEIPYGYTYIAVVIHPENVQNGQAFSILRGLSMTYLEDKVGEQNVSRYIEPYWLPFGWLRLGRGTDIRRALRGMEYREVPSVNDYDIPFTVGVYVGSAPGVAPINFANFHEEFFHGSDKVVAVNNTENIRNVDVLIYKAIFDPDIDSPGLLYNFARNFINYRLVRQFNRSLFLYYGANNENTVRLAAKIQSSWQDGNRIFPLFTEPISILVDTRYVNNPFINYREGFFNLSDWKISERQTTKSGEN